MERAAHPGDTITTKEGAGMTSPERSAHGKEITLEEARQDLAYQLQLMDTQEQPDPTFYRLTKEALVDDEALQIYVDTWNGIVRKQREMDAGF